MEIGRVDALDDAGTEQLIDLVQQIQLQPPHSYRAGAIPPASQWFRSVLQSSSIALVATTAGRPVGYCTGLSLTAYGKLDGLVAELAVDPATTMYLAELGVDPSARRMGVASALVQAFQRSLDPSINACVARTLAGNDPAIQMYRQHGYQLVPDVGQLWHGRHRIFLRWRRIAPERDQPTAAPLG